MITISLCMIVKNEEKVLARCLDSLHGLIDEIILVDTGSTDQTVPIARQYTDTIRHFEWCGDFSAARNYAMQFATMDYIYWADADEVLEESDRKAFLALKQTLNPSIEIIQMLYCNQLAFNTVYNYDSELRPKMYRRLSNFVFDGPVYEAVKYNHTTKILETKICIQHRPTTSHATRDLTIFLNNFGPGKEEIPARLHTQYARELFICGTDEDFLNAESIFTQSMENTTFAQNSLLEAASVLIKIAILKEYISMLLKYSLKAVAMNGCSEVFYLLGNYYENAGVLSEAAIWYYNAAFEASSILNIHYCTDLPLSSLVTVYTKLGMPDIAEQYRTRKKEV